MKHYTEEGLFTDVMIDLETTGTCPDRNAIIQISGVKFNLEDRTISPDFFDMSLKIPSHRFWCEDTRKWWSKMPDLYNKIVSTAQPHEVVLQALFDWLKPMNSLSFWSKPTHFDFMFMASYFKDAGMDVPCHFRKANDLNTFVRAMYPKREVPDLGIKMDGEAHNAIDDVLFQIKYLFEHANNSIVHKVD